MSVALVLWSGGIDSTTVLFECLRMYKDVHALTIDYGDLSRNGELMSIARLEQHIITQPKLKESYCGRIQAIATFDDHYMTGGSIRPYSEGYSPDLVPGRNTVFAMIAYYWARKVGAEHVYIAVHGPLDPKYKTYPDCTISWVCLMNVLYDLENETVQIGETKPQLIAPLIQLKKPDILKRARAAKVPVEDTWACFFPVISKEANALAPISYKHCGECKGCQTRKSIGLL